MNNDNLQLALDILRSRLDGLKGSLIFDINGKHIETNFDQKFQNDLEIVANKCSRIFDFGMRISKYDGNIVELEHIIVAGDDYSFFITPISSKLFTFVIAEDKIGDIHFHTSRGEESEVGIKDHLTNWVSSYHYEESITSNSVGLLKISSHVEEIENTTQVNLIGKKISSFLKLTSEIYILDKTSNTLYNILSNSGKTSDFSNDLFGLIYEIHDFIGQHTDNPLLSIRHITLWGIDKTGKEGTEVIFEINNRYSLVISSQNSLGEVLFWCKHILSDDINKLLNDKDYSLSTIGWEQEQINLINEGEQKACSPQECNFSMLINCEEKLPFGQPHTIARSIDRYEIPDIGTTIIDQASNIWDRLQLGELWKIVLIGHNLSTSLAPIGRSRELGFVSTSGQDFNFLDEPVNQGIDCFRKAFNKKYNNLNPKVKRGYIIPELSENLGFCEKSIYLGFSGIFDLRPGYKLKIKDNVYFIKNDIYHDFNYSFKFIEKALVFNHYALNEEDDELRYIIIQSRNACLIYKLGIFEGIYYFIGCIFDKNSMKNCENIIDEIDNKFNNYLVNKQKYRTNIIPFSQTEKVRQSEPNTTIVSKNDKNKEISEINQQDSGLPTSTDEQKTLIASKLSENIGYKLIKSSQFHMSGGEFDLILEEKTSVFKKNNYIVAQIVKGNIDVPQVAKFTRKCDEVMSINNIKKAYLITSNGTITKQAYELKNESQIETKYKLIINHMGNFSTE